jgi:hypothetical protein
MNPALTTACKSEPFFLQYISAQRSITVFLADMGLAIYLWDWIANFRAEYDLLWRWAVMNFLFVWLKGDILHSRRPCDMRATQMLYFATRFSALPCHA